MRSTKKYITMGLFVSVIFVAALAVCWSLLGKRSYAGSQETQTEQNVSSQTESSYDRSNVKKSKSTSDLLVLVNKTNALPDGYHQKLKQLKNGKFVANVMYLHLRDMWFDCEAQNSSYSIAVVSAYRSHNKQETLLQQEIAKNERFGMSRKEALNDALRTVAPSGYSEHETGLCVDITAKRNQQLNKQQEDMPENRWLHKHCAEYGFILRYPKGKEKITGYDYEPWHFRYVGKKAAKEIMQKKITLEEYLQEK